MSEDLPVPRAPVNKTLFAGLPATKCAVLLMMDSFWRSMPCKSSKEMIEHCDHFENLMRVYEADSEKIIKGFKRKQIIDEKH